MTFQSNEDFPFSNSMIRFHDLGVRPADVSDLENAVSSSVAAAVAAEEAREFACLRAALTAAQEEEKKLEEEFKISSLRSVAKQLEISQTKVKKLVTHEAAMADIMKRSILMESNALDEAFGDDSNSSNLIRTGLATPFSSIPGLKRGVIKRPTISLISPIQSNVLNAMTPKRAKLLYDIEKQELMKQSSLIQKKSSTALSSRSATFRRKNRLETIQRSSYFKNIDNKEQIDDGDDSAYESRLKKPKKNHASLDNEKFLVEERNADVDSVEEVEFDGGLRLLASIFDNLFEYQKTCVTWLWELHCQCVGGIIGDEMGLGKTIQVIAFLAALHHSGFWGPCLIVCPATVMVQWTTEIHKWYPPLRVAILHSSGSGRDSPKTLLRKMVSASGVVITTYETLRRRDNELTNIDWHYVVLDEGHKIRNPDCDITIACKGFRTPHRLILSGAPIQNNLKELWSLVDFVFPGKLGTLPVFLAQFAVPISIGGYVNANPVQVQTAYQCALALRDLINPYLLRRMKKDVQSQLPPKTEQVLFCRLTKVQLQLYKKLLSTVDMDSVLNGSCKPFSVIDSLRKICNHPDLVPLSDEYGVDEPSDEFWKKSGKLIVLSAVLKQWKSQGHRVLIFCQTRQMLDILEKYIRFIDYSYLRLDGQTPIGHRQLMIDSFNENEAIYVFLLTTRVGGLGINLCGANRVVLFDPDWNPSNDVQARERAWRIGQTRDVIIYRLVTSGTIEEKIYHRQIFKQLLTNKILSDPKQRRFFQGPDLRDLFTLSSDSVMSSTMNSFNETAILFSDVAGVQINPSSNEPMHDSDLIISETYQQSDGDEDRNGSSCILRALFDGDALGGLQTVLSHDRIVDGDRDIILNREAYAAKVAKQALSVLKKSRAALLVQSIDEPTWTGHSNGAGAPLNSSTIENRSSYCSDNRNVLPSSCLISRLRGRQANSACHELGQTHSLEPSRTRSVNEILVLDLRNALLNHGGRMSSADIVDKFHLSLSKEDVPIFRSLLQSIATFEANPDDALKGKVWILKPELV